jgi:hypothetical protein
MRKSRPDRHFPKHPQTGVAPQKTRLNDSTVRRLVLCATSRDRHSFAPIRARRSSADRAIDSLFTLWDQIPRSARRYLLAISEPRIIARLRHNAIADDPAARKAVARIPRLTPIPASIDLLPVLLRDQDPSVVREAEKTLHTLADHLGSLRDHQRDALEQTGIEVLQTYSEHHSDESIAAVERLGPWMGTSWREWFDTSDDAELMLLRTALRRADDQDAPTRAVAWMCIPSMSGAALEHLTRLRRAQDLKTLADAAHLLRTPARARSLRVRRADVPAGEIDTITRPDVPATLARLEWSLAVCPAPLPGTVAREGLLHPEASIRWNIARNCTNHAPDHHDLRSIVQDFTFDPHHSIARSSTIALLTKNSKAHTTQLGTLRSSAHPAVRRVAHLATLPARQWQANAAMRMKLHETPDLLLAQIRGDLVSSSESTILSALKTLERLRLAPRFEQAILSLLSHTSSRVCATAVTLTASIPTAAAKAALATVFLHDDPRVRANTIESVGKQNPNSPVVVRAAFDDIPRLRANGIRARFTSNPPEATSLLEDMLGDERADHRLSALWVTRRVAATALNTRIASLASSEPDIRVRQSAHTCARALLARIRTSELPSPQIARTSDTHAALT